MPWTVYHHDLWIGASGSIAQSPLSFVPNHTTRYFCNSLDILLFFFFFFFEIILPSENNYHCVDIDCWLKTQKILLWPNLLAAFFHAAIKTTKTNWMHISSNWLAQHLSVSRKGMGLKREWFKHCRREYKIFFSPKLPSSGFIDVIRTSGNHRCRVF